MYKSCPLECKILKGIWKNAYANDNVFCTTLYIFNFSDPYLFLRVFIFKSLSFPQSLYFQILIFSSVSLFSTVHNFNNAKISQNIVIILAQSFLCRAGGTILSLGWGQVKHFCLYKAPFASYSQVKIEKSPKI